jgi:DNA-binding GntR family transcriptional regulator
MSNAVAAALPETAADRGMPLTQSLPEQIAARLSERIVSGAYAPGRRIMEQAVAVEFAVSRGPVREALRLLERDGLVTFLPRRGAQVTALSIEEVREIFDIRSVLHGLRARLMAEGPDHERMLPVLEEHVKRMTQLARRPEAAAEYVEASFRLSRLLTTGSSNRRLSSILGALALQIKRYTTLGLNSPQRRKQSAQNWSGLLEAVKRRDGDAAESLARQLVTDSRDAAIRELEKHGTHAGMGN